MRRTILLALAVVAWAPDIANAEQLCQWRNAAGGADGRMLGHLPYVETRAADLVLAPAGFALGGPCRVRREMIGDLTRMLAAANATAGLAGKIRAVSCFRSVEHQRSVFCGQIGPKKRASSAADRAKFVGPPGYSEHATGFAIDFGTRPSPQCSDVNACFAATPAGRWLIDHAAEYGFELSFPAGNGQGVSWEPWHWRWVGTSMAENGAATARALFVRARAEFPGNPGVDQPPPRPIVPPPASAPVSALRPTPAP